MITIETTEQTMQPINVDIDEDGGLADSHYNIRNCYGCVYYGKECHGEICLLMEAFSGERREE